MYIHLGVYSVTVKEDDWIGMCSLTPCHVLDKLMPGNEQLGVIDFLFMFSIEIFCFSHYLLFNNINLSIESKKRKYITPNCSFPGINLSHAWYGALMTSSTTPGTNPAVNITREGSTK